MEYKKLLLVGEDNSGKSCYIKRLRTNEVEMRYIATMGVEVHPIYHSITYKVWDCAGKECFGRLRSGYYIGGECALVFFDLSRERTQGELLSVIGDYVGRVREVCEDIPIVVVGNKRDLVNEVDLPNLEELGLPYVFISSRDGTNMEQPLQMITQMLTH